MSIFHRFGHHVKHTALNVHGFFKGLLSGSTAGNSIGSLAGAGIGAGLALTGVISGGLLPALIMGVTIGAAVGVICGGAIGSLIGALREDKAEKEAASPVTIKRLEDAPSRQKTQGVAIEQDVAPQRPASVEEPKPAHFRSEEEDKSFRNRIAQERLAQATASLEGAAR